MHAYPKLLSKCIENVGIGKQVNEGMQRVNPKLPDIEPCVVDTKTQCSHLAAKNLTLIVFMANAKCVKTLCQIDWIRLAEYPSIYMVSLKDQRNTR